MSLAQKKAVDIMKKASGSELEERSITQIPHGFLSVVKEKNQIICVTDGPCAFADRLECNIDEYRYGVRVRFAQMSNKNSQTLRFFLKWTAPGAVTNEKSSIGFEDDFGLLLPVAADALQSEEVKPVLLSHMDSAEKLAVAMGDAAWQALATGLASGYAAEYSYAKNEQEVMNALLCGYTGIVIDIAGKINHDIENLAHEEIEIKFNKLPEDFKEALKLSYIEKSFTLDGVDDFSYTAEELMQYALCYGEAIAFAQYMYNAYFKSAPWPVDFILYIGEQDLPYKAHYLLANEFVRAGVKLAAIQLQNTSSSFKENLSVAANFKHKIRLLLPEQINSLAKDSLPSSCHFDLRPQKGSGLLTAYKILKEKQPEFMSEIVGSESTEEELLKKLAQNKEKVKQALLKHLDEYHAVLRNSIVEIMALIK